MNNHQQIEAVFRSLNREIWIVTAASGRSRGGLIATWVSQASLDPLDPVVVIGIATNHFTRTLIDESHRFGLHLLRPNQTELALNFATGSGRDRDKLAGLPLQPNRNPPVLADCASWLECEVESRVDGGDRVYYWSKVIGGQKFSPEAPLCEQQLIAAASPDQLAALKQNRLEDIELQRPLIQAWRANRER
ncbi:MAG: flavin reductase (DIM6/NTAB) family NADH-FMN oxidoreductase RutF [Pirellulaceae bacterium]|jgi:flavin reductase (DIM6/NTAB) family NADH-FMN oxidoreductase RutF